MKGIFQILRYTKGNWGAMIAWLILTVVSGALGEKHGTPGTNIALVAMFSIHFVGYQHQWERTLRLMPVDPRKLILGRYLTNALAGVASAIAFALGLLLGGHSQFLVEIPMILGCTILFGAVHLPPQYKYMESNAQKAGVAGVGFVTAMICIRLMRREWELVPVGENSGYMRILPVPLERSLVVLGIAVVGAVISYFVSCKWESEREW